MTILKKALVAAMVLLPFMAYSLNEQPKVDETMLAKIREEGFQRSQVMDIVGYMTDVLGARLTLSQDMKRAQTWAKDKMEKLGLVNAVIEPFMDYGAAWDNEYFSLHMLEPDYQYMMGFPLAYTPGTNGKVTCQAVLAEIQTKKDLEKYRSKLKGVAVLASMPIIKVTPEHYNRMVRILRRNIPVKIEVEVRNQIGEAVEKASNVVGAGAFRGINLQGNEFVRAIFAEWMAPFRDLSLTAITIQSVGSTDHVSFDRAGLPGFQFLQDRVGIGGHANMDFYDTLVPEDLMKNAVIMASFAYHAAMSDARIPRKTVK